MLRMWEMGVDGDPGFANRIEFHDPMGKVYVAKRFGQETLFGKTVERGIAARVLQYANDLLVQAYEVDEVDSDNDGKVDWYMPKLDKSGMPRVKFDATMSQTPVATCSAQDNSGCTCAANRSCVKLSRYVEMPFFFRQALSAYGLADPSMKGIYN
jgi:hypothetical protein